MIWHVSFWILHFYKIEDNRNTCTYFSYSPVKAGKKV